MQKIVNERQVEVLKFNGKPVTMEANFEKEEVEETRCSVFLNSKNLFASGEYENDDSDSDRNAKVLLTEVLTGKLLGKTMIFIACDAIHDLLELLS